MTDEKNPQVTDELNDEDLQDVSGGIDRTGGPFHSLKRPIPTAAQPGSGESDNDPGLEAFFI